MHGSADPTVLQRLRAGLRFHPDGLETAEWFEFLRQIWEDDNEITTCLQEWFGYLNTPDIRQQKFTMMVGPKRSVRCHPPLDPDQEPPTKSR